MISGTMLVHNGGGVYLFALCWCAAMGQAAGLVFRASSSAAAGIGRAYR